MKFKIKIDQEKTLSLEPGRTCWTASPEKCERNDFTEEEVATMVNLLADYGYRVEVIKENV